MSAFIISNETMNRIINGLYWLPKFKRLNSFLYNHETIKELLGYELDHQAERYKELAKELYNLNIYALKERYRERAFKDAEEEKAIKFKWTYDNKPNIYQFLKSVECLIYQCSEGDAMNKPLYKWLEQLEKEISFFIVTENKQYKNARWD